MSMSLKKKVKDLEARVEALENPETESDSNSEE